MRKVKIRFYVQEIGFPVDQDIEEILDLLPHGTRNQMQVKCKKSGIKGQGQNLSYAVLNYLKKRKAGLG